MRVDGELRVPGDKSISHRALLISALGEGPARIRGILDSADVRATARVLRSLGVAVPELSDDFVLVGVGHDGLQEPTVALDCGNSGTTARLVAGLVAASGFDALFEGDASLSRRPMRRIAEPLARMGASITFHGEQETLPMTVHGAVLGDVEWESETASAQVKSALLLAGLISGREVIVREPVRSRDHTERMLAARGAEVWVNEQAVMLLPGARIAQLDVDVPGDPSSAAFFAALAALADEGELRLPDVSVNLTRVGFYLTLKGMGADVASSNERQVGGEPVADLVVRPSRLVGIDLPPEQVPSMIDELPLLACVAARAEGETVIRGAGELRVKESDRIAAVVANLRAIGVEAEEHSDGMRVVGGRGPLHGFVETHGDHRLAMAFGVLAQLPGSEIAIDDRDCVAVSYPAFWSDVERLISR